MFRRSGWSHNSVSRRNKAILLHAIEERLARNVQVAGSLGLIPFRFFERLEEKLLFYSFQVDAPLGNVQVDFGNSPLLPSDVLWQILGC